MNQLARVFGKLSLRILFIGLIAITSLSHFSAKSNSLKTCLSDACIERKPDSSYSEFIYWIGTLMQKTSESDALLSQLYIGAASAIDFAFMAFLLSAMALLFASASLQWVKQTDDTQKWTFFMPVAVLALVLGAWVRNTPFAIENITPLVPFGVASGIAFFSWRKYLKIGFTLSDIQLIFPNAMVQFVSIAFLLDIFSTQSSAGGFILEQMAIGGHLAVASFTFAICMVSYFSRDLAEWSHSFITKLMLRKGAQSES